MKEVTIKLNKQSLVGFLAGVILMGGILGITFGVSKTISNKDATGRDVQKEEAAPQKPSNSRQTQKIDFNITKSDHVRGEFDAPVTIVEFSDFQCPFCQRFHPTVQRILSDYQGKVRWVYKHFPLDSIHPQARPAAEASECAAEQGKFWQFADGLFENQSRLGENLYQELASGIGLNMVQFQNCVSSRKYKDKVDADLGEGQRAGVTGTPGNFVNGEPVQGAVPYSTLKSKVEQVLEEF